MKVSHSMCGHNEDSDVVFGPVKHFGWTWLKSKPIPVSHVSYPDGWQSMVAAKRLGTIGDNFCYADTAEEKQEDVVNQISVTHEPAEHIDMRTESFFHSWTISNNWRNFEETRLLMTLSIMELNYSNMRRSDAPSDDWITKNFIPSNNLTPVPNAIIWSCYCTEIVLSETLLLCLQY